MRSYRSEMRFKALDESLGTDFFNVLRQYYLLRNSFYERKDSVKDLLPKQVFDEICNEYDSYHSKSGLKSDANTLHCTYEKMESEIVKQKFAYIKECVDRMQECYDKLDPNKATSSVDLKSLEDVLKFVENSALSEKDKRITTLFLKEMFK